MKRRIAWLISIVIVLVAVLHMLIIKIDRSRNLGLLHLITSDGKVDWDFAFGAFSITTVIQGCAVIVLIVLFHFLISNRSRLTIYAKDKKIFDSYDSNCNLFVNIVLVVMLVLYCVVIVIQLRNKYDTQQEIIKVREILLEQKTIIHAAGNVNIDGVDYGYTNSLEAVNSCYNSGNKVAEIDFMMTSDHKLICAHSGDEEDGIWASGMDFVDIPTEAEFMNSVVFGALTPMSLEDLAAFMRSHEDFYVVTDVKEDDNIRWCKYISRRCPDIIDRFIIQIYDSDEYAPIRRLGYKNIIYTLYRVEGSKLQSPVLRSNVYNMDLIGLTCWSTLKETIVDPLVDTDVLFFVHTVNDKEKMKSFVEQGVGVYTDNIDNDWLR